MKIIYMDLQNKFIFDDELIMTKKKYVDIFVFNNVSKYLKKLSTILINYTFIIYVLLMNILILL